MEVPQPSAKSPASAPQPRGRILIVDDESLVCNTVSGILSNAGFVCETTGTGTDALSRLASESYDCLISDVRMPGMDGFELLTKARAFSSDLEVILLTGMNTLDTAIAALKTGVSDYLAKPFDVEEILHCVNRAIEHRRLVLENREYQQHLEEKVQQQARVIRSQFVSAIQSLAKAVEARDPYTRGHSERVGNISCIVAQSLGLPPEESDVVRQAGLLHDIGKIGVPDGILQKRGPLVKTEWSIMQTHPTVGRDIVTLINPPATLADGVLYHHERWDGKGYPEGRTGTDIPLVGRILAVVDAFDAMTSARPYRDAYSREEALSKLGKARGSQLDPDIAGVMTEDTVQAADRVVQPPGISSAP